MLARMLVLVAGLTALWGPAGCVSDRYPDDAPLGTPAGVAALGPAIELGDALDAWYRQDGPDSITAVLVPRGSQAEGADGPNGSAFASMTVVRVLWRPQAGATPLSKTATNAALRHLVFAGPAADRGPIDIDRDEPPAEVLGLFTGAGFVGLGGDPDRGVLDLAVRQADLQLTDCSTDYVHPLRRTALTARVRARRDDAKVTRWIKAAGVRASAALGYPAWVRAAPAPRFPSGFGVLPCALLLPAPSGGV